MTVEGITEEELPRELRRNDTIKKKMTRPTSALTHPRKEECPPPSPPLPPLPPEPPHRPIGTKTVRVLGILLWKKPPVAGRPAGGVPPKLRPLPPPKLRPLLLPPKLRPPPPKLRPPPPPKLRPPPLRPPPKLRAIVVPPCGVLLCCRAVPQHPAEAGPDKGKYTTKFWTRKGEESR